MAGGSTTAGEQGDARHAVLLSRVVGALGDEAVLAVLAPGFDLEAGGLDRFAVGVPLQGAADARGPQRGVAGDALRSWCSVTMSASARRPPGRSARAAAANTAGLSGDKLITPLEITQSTLASSTGGVSM
jgi:hypothetical protein